LKDEVEGIEYVKTGSSCHRAVVSLAVPSNSMEPLQPARIKSYGVGLRCQSLRARPRSDTAADWTKADHHRSIAAGLTGFDR
jgi:hypothetical protein